MRARQSRIARARARSHGGGRGGGGGGAREMHLWTEIIDIPDRVQASGRFITISKKLTEYE
eukprot:7113873-Pyramimonas_sp.AAC.1